MKNLLKISAFVALVAVVINSSYADNFPLSEEQKLLLAVHMEQSEENFETFRSTLDVFQLAILENPTLKRHEKHMALKSTLTLEQQALLEANKVLEQTMREDFKNSLTTDQKKDLRQIIKASLDPEEVAIMEARKVLREAMKQEARERDFNNAEI